jgi:hypothetical protein
VVMLCSALRTCRFGGWKNHTRQLDPPVGSPPSTRGRSTASNGQRRGGWTFLAVVRLLRPKYKLQKAAFQAAHWHGGRRGLHACFPPGGGAAIAAVVALAIVAGAAKPQHATPEHEPQPPPAAAARTALRFCPPAGPTSCLSSGLPPVHRRHAHAGPLNEARLTHLIQRDMFGFASLRAIFAEGDTPRLTGYQLQWAILASP